MKKNFIAGILCLFATAAIGQQAPRVKKVTMQHQAGAAFRLRPDGTDNLFRPASMAFFLEEKIIIHYPKFGLSFTAGLINHPKERGIKEAGDTALIRKGGGIKANYFMLGLEQCFSYSKNDRTKFMLKYYLSAGIAILEARELNIGGSVSTPAYNSYLDKNTSFTFAAGVGIHTPINPNVSIGFNLDLQYFQATAFTRTGNATPVLIASGNAVNRVYLKPGLCFRFRF